MAELERQLAGEGRWRFEHHDDANALFTYHLHAMPNEVANRLSMSTAMAAWNAAVYVAQVDDFCISQAMQDNEYMEITNDVVVRNGGLWFQDESFVVVRDE